MTNTCRACGPLGARWYTRRSLPAAWALAAACVAFAAPRAAEAQITPTLLIGDSVTEPESPRFSDVSEAIKRYENRDLLGAKQFLETAKRKDSKLPPVAVMMAKLHLLSGNAAAVRPALEDTVLEAPDDPEPYLILAEDSFGANRTIEADALFARAVDLIGPYSGNAKRKRNFQIRAYRGRAAIAQRRQKWDLAEADLRKWLEVDPESAPAHQALGSVLFMLDKAREGYDQFVEAFKLDNKLPQPYVSAAVMYERRGAQSEAMQAFERAYKADPKGEQTLVQYAQALLKAGQLDKAETVLKAARAAVPSSVNVWLLSGVSSRMRGEPAEAETRLGSALTLAPANAETLNQLALLLADQDDAEKKQRARMFATTAAQLHQQSAEATITLAWVLYQTGQPREATAALQKGLQLGEHSADSDYVIARMLIAANQQEVAKKVLTAAMAREEGIFVQRVAAEKLLGTL